MPTEFFSVCISRAIVKKIVFRYYHKMFLNELLNKNYSGQVTCQDC